MGSYTKNRREILQRKLFRKGTIVRQNIPPSEAEASWQGFVGIGTFLEEQREESNPTEMGSGGKVGCYVKADRHS